MRGYDASVWSLSEFAQRLPHPMYLIPPSIDPLSDKNSDMSEEELANAYARWEIDPDRPVITQISRFDRFKDPLGVVRAYRLVKDFILVQLVLAGGEQPTTRRAKRFSTRSRRAPETILMCISCFCPG